MARTSSDILDGVLFDIRHEQVIKQQTPEKIMGRKIAEMYVNRKDGLDGFIGAMNDIGYLGRLSVTPEIKKAYKDIDIGELARATTGFYEYMKASFEKEGINLDSVPNSIRLMFSTQWLLIDTKQ